MDRQDMGGVGKGPTRTSARPGGLGGAALLAVLLVCAAAGAVDTLTVTDTGGQVAVVSYSWTADGSGNATGQTSVDLPGVLFGAALMPAAGGTAPSAGYDVVVKQVFSTVGGGTTVLDTDLAAGSLADRSGTGAEWVPFWPDDVYRVGGRIRIEVTGAGSGGQGRIELQVARFLALKMTDIEVPLTGGGPGSLLQYRAPAQGKWVPLSGEATVADGGAVTLQGSPTFTDVTATGDVTAGSDLKAVTSVQVGGGSPYLTVKNETVDGNPTVVFETDNTTNRAWLFKSPGVSAPHLQTEGYFVGGGLTLNRDLSGFNPQITIVGDNAPTFKSTSDSPVILYFQNLGLSTFSLDVDGFVDTSSWQGETLAPWEVYVPAGRMTAQTVGGQAPAAGSITTDTVNSIVWLPTMDFTAGNQEYAQLPGFVLPPNYAGQALKVVFYWTATTTGSGNVKWWLQYYVAGEDGDTLKSSSSVPTVQSDDTFVAVDKLHVISSSFTPSGASAGDFVECSVRRRSASTGADTFGQDARLLAVRITYN